jgi:sugar-specific transcriptional regulator TrmB
MDMSLQATQPALVALGFTPIEASAYAYLVQASPATGYGVARGIGKPVANTYQALQSLRHKGAVLVDGRGRRQWRAVPPRELLARIDAERAERVAEAGRTLARLHRADDDHGVYTLASRTQALARFRDMLERARRVALADVFPEPLAELRPALERAAARGITVAVMVYEPARLRGVEVVVKQDGPEQRQRWPGEWFNLVIDGTEHLLCWFGSGAPQATWSRSPHLSWIVHGGLWSEMAMARITSGIGEGVATAELARRLKRFRRYLVSQAPGYRRLRRPARTARDS